MMLTVQAIISGQMLYHNGASSEDDYKLKLQSKTSLYQIPTHADIFFFLDSYCGSITTSTILQSSLETISTVLSLSSLFDIIVISYLKVDSLQNVNLNHEIVNWLINSQYQCVCDLMKTVNTERCY